MQKNTKRKPTPIAGAAAILRRVRVTYREMDQTDVFRAIQQEAIWSGATDSACAQAMRAVALEIPSAIDRAVREMDAQTRTPISPKPPPYEAVNFYGWMYKITSRGGKLIRVDMSPAHAFLTKPKEEGQSWRRLEDRSLCGKMRQGAAHDIRNVLYPRDRCPICDRKIRELLRAREESR